MKFYWFLNQIQSQKPCLGIRVSAQVSPIAPHPQHSFQLENNLPANLQISKKKKGDEKGECDHITKFKERKQKYKINSKQSSMNGLKSSTL